MKDLSIFVIIHNGHEIDFTIISLLLKRYNIFPVTFSSWEDGLKNAEINSPDCIIIDEFLESTFTISDFLKKIKNDINIPSVKIAILGYSEEESKAIQWGGNYYIEKPLSISKIDEFIGKLQHI